MSMVISVLKQKLPVYKRHLVTLGLTEKNADKFLRELLSDLGVMSLFDFIYTQNEMIAKHNDEELHRPPWQRRFWRGL